MPINMSMVLQKLRMGQPLTPEEQMLVNNQGPATGPGPAPGAAAPVAPGPAPGGPPPMQDPMIAMAQRYRDEANAPAETQFDQQDLEAILGADQVPAEQEANARMMARAQKLRNAQMRQPDRIGLSSGTSYTPANSSGEMWANIAQQAVGAFGERKAEQRDKVLRQQQAEGEKLYKSRAYDPKTQMELDAARGLRDIKPPQVDLGKDTMADKLRKFRSRYMTV